MKMVILPAFLLLMVCFSCTASAATWYVAPPPLGSDSNPGTEAQPFATIQKGIDAASNGDTVIVAEATYLENIYFNGKNIVLTSTDPLNPTVVANTIIDGNQGGSVVTFSGTETETCVLSGFTIRKGLTLTGGGGICGETSGGWHFTVATIENNTITGNSANGGGGIYGCAGIIRNNIIIGNECEWRGGGLHHCWARIQDNRITLNSAAEDGGGLSYCGGTIENNTITDNSANGGGGGLFWCDGAVHGNTVRGNQAGWVGGGLSNCGGTIANNTIEDNSALRTGAGLDGCHGTIRNNTIKDNWIESGTDGGGGGLNYCNGNILSNTIVGNSAGSGKGGGLSYCCGRIENNLIAGNSAGHNGGGLWSWEEGVGINDPSPTIQNNTIVGNSAGNEGGGLWGCQGVVRNCIIWGNSAPTSPQLHKSSIPTYSCIEGGAGAGGGNIASEPGFVDPAADDYHLQEGSPCIDAGASFYWLAWPQRDLDGNCRLAGEHVDMGCYEYGSSIDTDGDLLSDADEQAEGTDPDDDSDGDGLRDGLELLRGSNPLELTPPGVFNVPSDFAMIQQSLCVSIAGDEIIVAPGAYGENLEFPGFDITLRSCDPSNETIVSQTIIEGVGGEAVVSFVGSESAACVLKGFTIRNGQSLGYGGGICGGKWGVHTQATIHNNMITGNSALGGGGLSLCNGIIQNNTITGNSARNWGGGLYQCNEGAIRNNVIACNSTTFWWKEGGGLAECTATIHNNTIVANSANVGGGLWRCQGVVRSCIIWGNIAPTSPQLHESSTPAYSCIEGWSGGGQGNIVLDPEFVDPDGPDNDPATHPDNNYRLLATSPCIDTGKNEFWMLAATDLDGNPRIFNETVDMGAYEYQGSGMTLIIGVTPIGAGATAPAVGEYVYNLGTVVNIDATGNGGWVFDHWDGPVDGSPTEKANKVTMDSDKMVIAVFAGGTEVVLTMGVSPAGAGTTAPAEGIYGYAASTVVPIDATANAGWAFDHWIGPVDGDPMQKANHVTMNENKAVTAVFLPQYTLTMAVNFTQAGTTTPAIGDHVYNEGTVVIIDATGNAGWVFDYWEGPVELANEQKVNQVTMNADKMVTAVFIAQTETITCDIVPNDFVLGNNPAVWGQITPGREATVNIDFHPPSGADIRRTALSHSDGSYTFNGYMPDQAGEWTVRTYTGKSTNDNRRPFTVQKASPEITCVLVTEIPVMGNAVIVEGSLTPNPGLTTIHVSVERPNHSLLDDANVPIDSTGSYEYSFIPDVCGLWWVEVSWAGNQNYNPASLRIAISVGEDIGRVIIVAGSNMIGSHQSKIDYCTDRAHTVFLNRTFTDEKIYHLHPVLSHSEKVDAESRRANFQYTVETWAAEGVNANVPLVIYMMDHGGRDRFCLNATETVSASDLASWLAQLRSTSGCTNITVIYAACYAGSFLDELASDNLIIVSSTGSDSLSYPSQHGELFSDIFFTQIANGEKVGVAFKAARETVIKVTRGVQTPWLDDNGDGIYDSSDGYRADRRALGTTMSGFDQMPIVLAVSEDQRIGDATSADLWAEVSDAEGLQQVFAYVMAPSYEPPSAEEFEMPELGLPLINLTDSDKDGRYQATYNAFNEEGTYRIVVFGLDTEGNLSTPMVTYVIRGWRCTMEKLPDARVRICWDSQSGYLYQVQARSDLCGGEWVSLGPRMGGTDGTLYLEDPVEGIYNRFYRVQMMSP